MAEEAEVVGMTDPLEPSGSTAGHPGNRNVTQSMLPSVPAPAEAESTTQFAALAERNDTLVPLLCMLKLTLFDFLELSGLKRAYPTRSK